jgi:predicted ATPase/DNA-binding SARP family transcriptional activator
MEIVWNMQPKWVYTDYSTSRLSYFPDYVVVRGMDTAARLSLALLGSFEVTLDGHSVTTLESVKVRALLAYLAVEVGRSHTRAFLAELLWPDLPAATALTYLRHVLAKLKEAIPDSASSSPPFLLITRDTIALNPAGDYQLDILSFTALLESCATHPHRHPETCRSCARRHVAAVALYRGDFLDHFLLGDSAAFEEWAALKRERLCQQMLDALACLTTFYERRGAFQDAQRTAWRRGELDPWGDEAAQQLMRVLWLSGQRSAALAHYARYRRILHQELGVEPSAETTALYERIYNAETSTPSNEFPSPPSHNLPAQTTRLIGREAELAQLTDLLQQPAYRLITLSGAGGIGKTRLALQVASELLNDFADGVCFVALASVTEPALVLSLIAQALGVQESSAQPLLKSLIAHLRGRQLLLVLDNFEHVSAAAPFIADLLSAASQLTVLVTSRDVLCLYGEYEFPVPSLTFPDARHLLAPPALNQYEAVRLFVERGQAVHPDFAVTDETASAIAEICQRLDGLPLAIELAAARIRLLSPQAILQRLDSPLTLLTGGRRDLPARHQTLRATIDWSYNLLPAGEQRLLARLAVFLGGWTLEIAEAICAAGTALSITTLDGMEALVAKSLVRRQLARTQATSTPRFGMLEAIREYALERLEASGEADAVRCRHLLFFRNLAEAAEPQLHSAEQVRWLIHLEDEHPNMRAALAWAIEQEMYDDGLRLATAIMRFWHLRGHDREGYQWMQRFLAAPQAITPATRARALPTAAFFAMLPSDLEQAKAWAREGISTSREISDLRSLVYALVMLGWSERDVEQRVALMDEALIEARKLGNTWWLAMALWFKSDIYTGRDDKQAQALMEASLPLFRRVGDGWSIGWNLAELGHVVYRQGQYERAALLFEESLAQLTTIGHSSGIAIALHGLGMAAYDRGEYPRAAALLGDALARFREAGHWYMFATVLCARGKVALAQGDAELASVLLEESYAVCQTLEDRIASGLALHLLGRVARQQGNVARASMLLRESLRRRQDGAINDILESLEGLAGLAVMEEHLHIGHPERVLRAVRLLGAAAAARDVLGLPLSPGDRVAYECDVAAVRNQLDAAAWHAAWAEGRAMSLEQAVAYALTNDSEEHTLQQQEQGAHTT